MYHYAAHDPLIRTDIWRYMDDSRVRYRRILLPATAFVLALGQPSRIDTAYIVANSLFLILGAWWLSRYLDSSGTAGAISNFVRLLTGCIDFARSAHRRPDAIGALHRLRTLCTARTKRKCLCDPIARVPDPGYRFCAGWCILPGAVSGPPVCEGGCLGHRDAASDGLVSVCRLEDAKRVKRETLATGSIQGNIRSVAASHGLSVQRSPGYLAAVAGPVGASGVRACGVVQRLAWVAQEFRRDRGGDGDMELRGAILAVEFLGGLLFGGSCVHASADLRHASRPAGGRRESHRAIADGVATGRTPSGGNMTAIPALNIVEHTRRRLKSGKAAPEGAAQPFAGLYSTLCLLRSACRRSCGTRRTSIWPGTPPPEWW